MTSTEPYADDEFTDIELAELDEAEPAAEAVPVPVAPDRAPLGAHLDDARARATELQQFATDLTQLDDADLSDHVTYYQRAHAELQRALGDIDNA